MANKEQTRFDKNRRVLNNLLFFKVLYRLRSTFLSMSTFTDFAIRCEYASLAALGDRLGEISGLLNWDAFRSLLADPYTNDTGKGGLPNYDVTLMIWLL